MNDSPPCTEEALSAGPVRQPETNETAWGHRQIVPEREGTPISNEPEARPRVLVAEDDIFFRQLNMDVLIHSGCTVEAVEDGAAAWEALKVAHYDLLVTDNSMPYLSGVDLLRKLHAAHINLPVIMATGAIPSEELNRLPALHPAVILQKPYAVTELVRAVKRVLSEAHALSHSE